MNKSEEAYYAATPIIHEIILSLEGDFASGDDKDLVVRQIKFIHGLLKSAAFDEQFKAWGA